MKKGIGVIFKKTLIVLIVILILAASFGIFYLNEVVLPTDVKAAIVGELRDATRKDVSLASIKFDIFKGLVLKDLAVYDGPSPVVSAKEISFGFLILPFFRREVIMPAIYIESPAIFLERRADNSINLADLIPKEYAPKRNFRIIVRKIILKNAKVNFIDRTLEPAFTKDVGALDAFIYFSFPEKIEFDIGFADADLSGEYLITEKELNLKAAVNNVPLKEFEKYYEKSGVSFNEGAADLNIKAQYKEGILSADVDASGKDLVFSQGPVSGKLDSNLKGNFQYSFTGKKFTYTGALSVNNLDLTGAPFAERIDGIKGEAAFSDSSLSSDKLSAKIFDMPVELKTNLTSSLFDVYITSEMGLRPLQELLKDKFGITVPADLDGKGRVYLAMQYKLGTAEPPAISGALDLSGGTIKWRKDKPPLEDINGVVGFTANHLTWSGLDVRYGDTDYTTSGTLTNFETPGVQMELASDDLKLKTVFAVNDKLVTLSRFAGRYKNSEFSIAGTVDLDLPSGPGMGADIRGNLDIDTGDLKSALKELKGKFERMKIGGRFRAEFGLSGNAKDLKYCSIDAKVTSNSFSLYDLKPTNLIIEYTQKSGVGLVTRIHSFLYGGTLDAAGKIDLAAKDMPYSFSADIKGVRLEKLKTDTVFKDKDIAGMIRLQTKISGFSDDLGRLTGSGRFAISNGKLWELNLFKGLGVLIFTSDFSEIIFRDGICNFEIKEKAVSTDDMRLKSDLINMYGSVKVDFSNNINASLKAEIPAEAMEPGVRKNIATALGKYSRIAIVGTLKEPKYQVRPDVAGVVEDIRGIFSEGY